MTSRLKAWCHWKRKENHVSDEDMLMVRDIEALLAENAKLRDVVEAAKNASNEIDTFYLNVKQEDHVQSIEEDQHALWSARDAIDKALERLEAVK